MIRTARAHLAAANPIAKIAGAGAAAAAYGTAVYLTGAHRLLGQLVDGMIAAAYWL